MSIKMGYTVYMGHGYVCGDPQLQLMCTVLVMFSNAPCKTCVDVEVIALVLVFWVLEVLEQIPITVFFFFIQRVFFFKEMTNMWRLFCKGMQFQSLWSLSIDVYSSRLIC